VDLAAALGRVVPFAFTSGINLYATVFVLGVCSRWELVALPDQYRAFGHPLVMAVAGTLYLVEFVADKIPWVDTLWDAIHTVVRPVGGAFVAVTALGEASPAAGTLAALVGGSVALTTHLGKAGTRAAANASPEPFSNWVLSLGEDLLAVGMTYLAIEHPWAALGIVLIVLLLILAFAAVLIKAARRRFRGLPAPNS
jgi:hypothetical protein